MNRLLFAFCFAGFGLVLLRPAPAAADSFRKLPGAQGKTSPLVMRVVQYNGSTNGAITVEVKNPTGQPQEFSAKGIYFVPTGNPNEAPQRLGAVGPFQLQTDNGKLERTDHTTIAAGATARVSIQNVTGPSFTRSTAMSAPKRPVSTVRPAARSPSATRR